MASHARRRRPKDARSWRSPQPTDPAPLHDLATRLQRVGCDTDTTGNDWLKPGRFPNRDRIPQAPPASGSDTGSLAPAFTGSGSSAPAKSSRSAVRQPTRLTRTLTGHEDSVHGVAFSPVSGVLATVSADHTARLWDLATGRPACTLTGHQDEANGVAFSRDGTLLATASSDRTARLWDLATGQPARTLTGHEDAVWGVAFSPDGVLLVTASEDNTLRMWDLATGKCIRILISHSGPVLGVAFSPDGALLATASADGTARLWS